MSQQTFILSHPTARQRALAAVSTAPEGYAVVIKEPTRTLEQNALIHALLTDVGNLISWKFNGQDVDLADVKTIFVSAYRKSQNIETRFVIGIDGQPVILNTRTRDFSKRECGEFVDMVQAWMSQHQK